jgi:hypothetical protein
MATRFGRFGTALWRSAMACMVVGSGLAGSASATLLDRGPDLVYDDVLNITWTRQGGDGVRRSWAESNAWAANLVFGGFDDWRLPFASVSAGVRPATSVVFCHEASEPACRDNEMGYMLYHNLAGSLGDGRTGTQTALGGEVLTGIQVLYWSGTEFDPGGAWDFSFAFGDQIGNGKDNEFWAWAVREGDVFAVPEPSSLLLIGAAMLGLVWTRHIGRRR